MLVESSPRRVTRRFPNANLHEVQNKEVWVLPRCLNAPAPRVSTLVIVRETTGTSGGDLTHCLTRREDRLSSHRFTKQNFVGDPIRHTRTIRAMHQACISGALQLARRFRGRRGRMLTTRGRPGDGPGGGSNSAGIKPRHARPRSPCRGRAFSMIQMGYLYRSMLGERHANHYTSKPRPPSEGTGYLRTRVTPTGTVHLVEFAVATSRGHTTFGRSTRHSTHRCGEQKAFHQSAASPGCPSAPQASGCAWSSTILRVKKNVQ